MMAVSYSFFFVLFEYSVGLWSVHSYILYHMASPLAYLSQFLLWVWKLHNFYEIWYFLSSSALLIQRLFTGNLLEHTVICIIICCASCRHERVSYYPLPGMTGYMSYRLLSFFAWLHPWCWEVIFAHRLLVPLLADTHSLPQLVKIFRQWRTSSITFSILLIRHETSFGLFLRLGIIGVFSILSMGSVSSLNQLSALMDQISTGCQPLTCLYEIGMWLCVLALLGLHVSKSL